MSLIRGFDTVRLVRTGPNLRERVERRIAGCHRRIMVARLRSFRQQVERDMEPEPWTKLEVPMVLLLSDVCEALALNEEERASILGQQGQQALTEYLETRPVIQSWTPVSDRQIKALDYVREHGSISLGTYREICPYWSDETLRLDLASLAARGLLVKNGVKKGTFYTLPESSAVENPTTILPSTTTSNME